MFQSRRWWATTAFLLLSVMARPSFADADTQFQLVDLDTAWEETAEMPGHNFYLVPLRPGIWGEAWRGARLVIRLEIAGKPSDEMLEHWICLWCPRWAKEVCTYAPDRDHTHYPRLRFDKDGVYYHVYPPVTDWPGAHAKTDVRFDPAVDPVTHVTLQLFGLERGPEGRFRDERGPYRNRKLRRDHWTDNDALQDHVPFGYRAEVWVVAAGATFKPPAHWHGWPANLPAP